MQEEKSAKSFLNEVETRIPQEHRDQSSPPVSENQDGEKSSVATQTLTNNISPSVSSCWISDNASMDPYASSMIFSVTEDSDPGGEGDNDSDGALDGDDGWSSSTSSSCSSHSRVTPTAFPHGDEESSPSLSESLDTLDLNDESGLGTTSTRPSVSPPPITGILSSSPPEEISSVKLIVPPNYRSMERSTSNLSSEDTGVDVSLSRKVRRTLSSRRAREATLNCKNHCKAKDECENKYLLVPVGRKDQSTQTEEPSESSPTPHSFPVGESETPVEFCQFDSFGGLPSYIFGSSKQEIMLRDERHITTSNQFSRPERASLDIDRANFRQRISKEAESSRSFHSSRSEPRIPTLHKRISTVTASSGQRFVHSCEPVNTLESVNENISTVSPSLPEVTNCDQTFPSRRYQRANTIAAISFSGSRGPVYTAQPFRPRPKDLPLSQPVTFRRPFDSPEYSPSPFPANFKGNEIPFLTSKNGSVVATYTPSPMSTKSHPSSGNTRSSPSTPVLSQHLRYSKRSNSLQTSPALTDVGNRKTMAKISQNGLGNLDTTHSQMSLTTVSSHYQFSQSSVPPRPPSKATSTPALSVHSRLPAALNAGVSTNSSLNSEGAIGPHDVFLVSI